MKGPIANKASALQTKYRKVGVHVGINHCVGVVSMCDTFGVENVEPVSLDEFVVHGCRVILVAGGMKFPHVIVSTEITDRLGGIDAIIFCKVRHVPFSAHLTWVDINSFRDKAEYHGCMDTHRERKKAFSSECWVLEAEHLRDMASFPVGLCRRTD